jgi:predicted AlkP superfamily pyrophosphatase or phosphodiesterase
MAGRRRFALAALMVCALPLMPSARQTAPKLLVVIAVDQMRGDYVDKYRQQWSAGLKRLVEEGAWFRQADYPYFNTVTCAGHASISTGTIPAVHGMILNAWWDRAANKSVACTDDPNEHLISYGAPVESVGQSARKLLAPALADELRLQHGAATRVVSISLKARSAINLGGHKPDVVTWLDDNGTFVTSTAFTKAPVPFVDRYIRSHPVDGELGRVWDRLLPRERYIYDDSTVGRHNPAIGTTTFPHTVGKKGGHMDEATAAAWEASPFSDAYLAALAIDAVTAMKLGRGDGVDFLGVSFSALDKVGHDFGPDSHEVQDVLMRLDREIGSLLTTLDREVGRGSYTLALSADHGVSPVVERLVEQGFDAGRVPVTQLAAAIDKALQPILGPGKYVAKVVHTDVYFLPGVYDRIKQTPDAMTAAIQTIRNTPGVWRVYRGEALADGDYDADPITRAASRSYFIGRSGDLVLLPRAYWVTSDSTTTHGTGHRYDTRVPVILFGRGIKPGQYLDPISPLDIAPTLAFLTSVTLADPFGRLLTEALAQEETAHTDGKW